MGMNRYVVKTRQKAQMWLYNRKLCSSSIESCSHGSFCDTSLEEVEIETPKGWALKLPIAHLEKGQGWACCGIKKDGGDDPDVTDGLVVYSKVELILRKDIIITAGEGVGIVTKPGLQIKPGEPAINPVPRAMIKKEVYEVLPEDTGVKITISIPGGQQVAKRTFNPRLGIEGGLSIIGYHWHCRAHVYTSLKGHTCRSTIYSGSSR